jgi:hypothetical protein
MNDEAAPRVPVDDSEQTVARPEVVLPTVEVLLPTDAAPTAAVPNTTDAAVASPPKKKKSATATRRSKALFPNFASMLYQLLAFRCQAGHFRVPVDDAPLGPWVSLIRRCYSERNRGKRAEYLSQLRIEILDSIGFTWSVQQCNNDKRWEANFALLCEYKKTHGDCVVPQSTVLGKWVQMQREQNKGRLLKQAGQSTGRAAITLERFQKLNAIGFSWRVAKEVMGWDRRLEELMQFRHVHGHTNVPQGYKPNIALGRWVMKQRVQYQKKKRGLKSQMIDDRIERLEEVGFEWVGLGAQANKKKSDERRLHKEGTAADDGDEEQQEHEDSQHQQQVIEPHQDAHFHPMAHLHAPPLHHPHHASPPEVPVLYQHAPPLRELHPPPPFYSQWM